MIFLRDIHHEMVDDQERMKEGSSRERIWQGKFHFPRDLFAYFRATLFFTSVARREPWIQGYLACSSQNPQLRSFRSAVYPSPLKGEVVFIFSYIPTFFFRVFGHFEKPLFFELCKYIQTKFVPANTLLFRPGQVCFHFFASFRVT